MITQLQLDLITRFLHYTTEPFDDWNWDGKMLVIWLNDEPIERYLLSDVREFIKGFK
ncbi:MAG: hypothetical protein AAB019_05520 [Planctomycetota bacterium]